MSRVEITETATETPARERESRGLSRSQLIRATYDAAQTTENNLKHWAAADSLSPTAANSFDVRSKLRERSRYEIANNPYADGAVKTIVDDTVGRGPRHLVRSGDLESDVDREVGRAFGGFLETINLPDKLRVLKRGQMCSGEAFGFMTRGVGDRSVRGFFDPVDRVELGFHVVEADRVETPSTVIDEASGEVSGIEFDDYGNPVAYHLLDHHPGDSGGGVVFSDKFKRVPASMVCHYFEPRRPGDARGIPPFTSALELMILLRRYTTATVASAELVSSIAGMLKTNSAADGETAEVAALDVIEFVRNMIQVLPEGWDFVQPRAEQPTTTYGEFARQILREIARAVGLPYNIFAGDSSDHNYASGRLDHQGYRKMIEVDRSRIVSIVLNPLFWAWFDEASRVSGILPSAARTIEYRRRLRVNWFFDGSGHVDPVKEANGVQLRLDAGITSLQDECAREGRDMREVLEQQANEIKIREELGLPPRGGARAATTNDDQEEQEEEARR